MTSRKRPDAGDKDIIVVGAGIVGICTSLALVEKGFAVRVVDPDPPAAGASSGNAGVISRWSCVPQSMPGLWKEIPRWLLDPEGPLALRWAYVPQLLPWLVRFIRAGAPGQLAGIGQAMLTVNQPSVDLFRRFLDGTGESTLVRDCLYLHVHRDPVGANLELLPWRLRRDQGAPVSVLSGGELREIEPALSPEFKAAVAVQGQGRTTNPGRLGEVLAAKAQALGVEFVRRRVLRLVPALDGQCRLDTDQGELSSSQVIVAAGAWSARLLTPLGVSISLEAERGYHLDFEEPGVTVNNSILDVERQFVTSSMEMGVRSAGTAEFAGLDAAPNYRRARVFTRLAKRLLPKLNTASAREWMGVRPATPDSLPCIGPVPGHPNIFGAFGHGHLGLTGAPMTGRMVAAMAAHEPLNVDAAPFRLERFG